MGNVKINHLKMYSRPLIYFLVSAEIDFFFFFFEKLKYHDTGKEKDCLPQVGQWNMMNKVLLFHHFLLVDLTF